jgi:dethiobiotin synthetase
MSRALVRSFVVTATDTDVGKTVFCAALVRALDGVYWKPVQAGLEGETDLETVRRLSGLGEAHFLPERYRLTSPLSPHRAAELDGIEIDPALLAPPATQRTLVIEGAGGLLVPVTRKRLFVELFREWNVPVILCARTALGTINHTLLSVEALRARGIALHGVAFIGDENADSERTICEIGQVRRLGRLPLLSPLDPDTLQRAFAAQFRLEDFRAAG